MQRVILIVTAILCALFLLLGTIVSVVLWRKHKNQQKAIRALSDPHVDIDDIDDNERNEINVQSIVRAPVHHRKIWSMMLHCEKDEDVKEVIESTWVQNLSPSSNYCYMVADSSQEEVTYDHKSHYLRVGGMSDSGREITLFTEGLEVVVDSA